MKTTFFSLPVDYFLWTDRSQINQTLVYYDENGQAHEKEVPKEQIEKALKFFDGKQYSLPRTNGGIMNAEPYELVICECKRPGFNLEPEVRIGLKFTDLKRDRTRMVTSNESIFQTKYISCEELGNAIDWTTGREQRYVLEFGRGLIAVRVLQFIQNEKGVDAVFVREDELRILTQKNKKGVRSLNVYQVPRDVLRKSRPLFGGNTSEFDVALENMLWLAQTGDTIVPHVLKVSEREITSDVSLEKRVDYLQQAVLMDIHRKKRNKKASEKLIPFGVFEIR